MYEPPIPASSFLPVPRLPAPTAHVWPDADLLDELVPGSGTPVREAREIREAARKALEELEESRPGGARWIEAREVDRDKYVSTDQRKRGKPAAVANLLKTEPDRYGRALAEASTIVHRLDERRASVGAIGGILDAIDDDYSEVAERLSETAFRFHLQTKKEPRSEAYRLLEEIEALKIRAAWLRGLRAWVVGDDHQFDATGHGAGMTESAIWWYRDGKEILDPPPEGESWRDRENRRMASENFRATVEDRDLPHPRPMGAVS